ncbi:MAG: gamma-glutamylcyclotransferase family protein [Paracoccaceae bacterium]|uniref:gamma-glutamylcyclotransferase family protein n=1 Tax=Sulfitobacter pontiacus TaxID=60137 RepID=UPI00326AEBA2
MTSPFFFGYGSLVNRATHLYSQAYPAQIKGWRRAWRHVEGREVAFLTAVPDQNSTIDGLIAGVPDGDWSALDAREVWYQRDIAKDVSHTLTSTPHIEIYHAPEALHRHATAPHPVLLSYIDVVVQGYLSEFGENGVARFFETTDGWDAPIKNDRNTPIYPRHQKLSRYQKKLVDLHLNRVCAKRI